MIRERIQAYRADLDEYVLACARPTWSDPKADSSVLDLVVVTGTSPVALLQENLTVNERGFDPAAAECDEESAEAFRPNLAGCHAVTARLDGQAVSGGMFLPVRDGVSEIVGVATLAEFRGRGFASAVTAALTRAAFAQGAEIVFLTTDDERTSELYRRLGFAPIAE